MTREEAYNRIDAIIAKHEIDDEYVTITSFLDYDALRMARKALEQEPKIKCEDCKYFRKLPFHAGTIGKCVHHTGFCPKGDWYCADHDPQESEDKE